MIIMIICPGNDNPSQGPMCHSSIMKRAGNEILGDIMNAEHIVAFSNVIYPLLIGVFVNYRTQDRYFLGVLRMRGELAVRCYFRSSTCILLVMRTLFMLRLHCSWEAMRQNIFQG